MADDLPHDAFTPPGSPAKDTQSTADWASPSSVGSPPQRAQPVRKIWQWGGKLPTPECIRPPEDLISCADTIPGELGEQMLRVPGRVSFCREIGQMCGGTEEKVKDAWMEMAVLPASEAEAIASNFVRAHCQELALQDQAGVTHHLRLLLSPAGIALLRGVALELRAVPPPEEVDGLAVDQCWAWCAPPARPSAPRVRCAGPRAAVVSQIARAHRTHHFAPAEAPAHVVVQGCTRRARRRGEVHPGVVRKAAALADR